VKQIRLLV